MSKLTPSCFSSRLSDEQLLVKKKKKKNKREKRERGLLKPQVLEISELLASIIIHLK